MPIPDQAITGASADALAAAVTEGMRAAGASGAIAAVWVPWAGSWVQAVGTTTTGGETPVTTDMHFRIGQVTRAMTCDVLYALDDSGRLSVDDSVTTYVKTVPELENVTLKQLCDQSSGLTSSMPRLNSSVLGTPQRQWNPREFAAAGIVGRGAGGSEAIDSDAGYLLLGLALEAASGMSTSDMYSTYLFDPMGLSSTEMPTNAVATAGTPLLNGQHSPSGDRSAGCVAPIEFSEISPSFSATDGGVTSTISDLARYGQSLALSSRNDAGEVTARWQNALPLGPSGLDYVGGGILAGGLIGQQGWMPGYLTAVYADPATGLTVALVLNNSAGKAALAGDLARELAAIATKVPAISGQTQPQIGLTWTAEQARGDLTRSAVCPIS